MLFLPLKKFEDTVQIFMGSGELKNLVEIFRNETVTQEKKTNQKAHQRIYLVFNCFIQERTVYTYVTILKYMQRKITITV